MSTVTCPKCKYVFKPPAKKRDYHNPDDLKECYRVPRSLERRRQKGWYKTLGFASKTEWYKAKCEEAIKQVREINREKRKTAHTAATVMDGKENNIHQQCTSGKENCQ